MMWRVNRLSRLILTTLALTTLAACERSLAPAANYHVPAIAAATSKDDTPSPKPTRRDAKLRNNDQAPLKLIDEMYPVEATTGGQITELEPAMAGDLSVSFQDAGLAQVLKVILGDLLRLNYVLPPKLTGQVTLRTPRPLTQGQMLRVLDQVLANHGLVAIHEPEITRIIPAANAVTNVERSGSRTPGYGMEAIALRYIGASEMARLLKPVLKKDGALLVDPARNLIVLAGSLTERDAARRTIRVFDIDQMAGQLVALVGLEKAEPETVIAELQQIFGEDVKGPLGGLVRFFSVKRMNAIMAIGRQSDYLDQAREWIGRLDRTRDADRRRLFVYFVKNGVAGQLVETLGGAFGEGVVPTDSNTDSSLTSGSTAPQTSAGTNTESPNKPRFMADKASNALLVWATQGEYDIIAEVLAKLDISPLQVLIEGTVIEITLRDRLRYGLQYFLEVGDVTSVLTRGESRTTVNPGVPGFGVTIEGSNSSRLVIDALSDLTDVRVVSSPQLLVVDGETAHLHVGDQVPIVTRTSSTTATDDSRIVNEIEYRDTGVTLHVTPKVKSSGLVSLDILQEVSRVIRTETSDIDSPTIQQRRINSTAAINDGSTVMLAGLIRERDDDLDSGIPVLHKLPVVGKLFGSTNSDRRRTELIVLISPRVVRDRAEARSITRDMLKRYEGLLDSLRPSKPAHDRP